MTGQHEGPPAAVVVACGCGEPVLVQAPDEPRCGRCRRTYPWRDGILILDDVAPAEDDYPVDLYRLLADVEDRHFWFTTRNAVINSVVRRIENPAGRSVLDVGCGTGVVLGGLEQAGMVACGLDMHMPGLNLARRRVSGLLVRSGAATVPFVRQFDWVMLCDVIEHLDDDVACLKSAADAVRPGGHLLITVPADPRSWSRYDEVIGHKRRYSSRSLTAAMTRAGLVVRCLRYFNAPLLIVQRLHRRLATGGSPSEPDDRQAVVRRTLRVPPAPLNALCTAISAVERNVCRLAFPCGASLIAVESRSGGGTSS